MLRIERDQIKCGDHCCTPADYDTDRGALPDTKPPVRPTIPANAEAIVYVPGDRCMILASPGDGHGVQEIIYGPTGWNPQTKRWSAGDNMLARADALRDAAKARRAAIIRPL